MKKILLISSLVFILASCGVSENEDQSNDNSANIIINGQIDDDGNNLSTQVIVTNSGAEVDEANGSGELIVEDTNSSTGTGVQDEISSDDLDGETEEVMEDFEKDINELFDMLESDDI